MSCFNKKNFLQTLVEIIFKYYDFFYSVGYQNRLKKVCEIHFYRNFKENIQKWRFGFKIVEKGQILMPFSGLAPSTLI